MPAIDTLSSLLGVRPGEWRTVAPALGFAFLGVGAMSLAAMGADALFVSTFSLGALARFTLVGAAVRVAVAFAYAAIARRLAGPRLDGVVLAATAALMGASGWAARGAAPAVVYAVCVAQLVLPPLLPLVTFNAVTSCFHARQAKRLLPLVAAAATLGTIAVGGAARLVAAWRGASGLLVLGGALCAVALPLPWILAERAREANADDLEPAPSERTTAFFDTLTDAARDMREVPAVRIVVFNAAIGAAAVAFVDYAFKATLKARFDQVQMASFLGTFTLASNVAVLATQILFASRFVGRFGVRAALQLFPASLVGLGPLVAAVPGLAMGVGTKLAEMLLRLAVGASVADLLLTPTAAPVRTRAKVVVKGIAAPVGVLVSGALLTSFGESGPPPIALGALLFASGILGWLVVTGARRAYTSALADALEGRVSLDVSPQSASMLRSELVRLLAESSASGDAKGAARTLGVMSDRFFTLADLAPALSAGAVEIRRAAVPVALRIARASNEGARLLELARADDDDDVERALLGGARELGATPPKDRALRAAERARAGESEGAIALWAESLACLALHDRDVAVKELRKAALGVDSPRRAAALRALGELGERRAEREVLRAMGSDDAAVFAAAAKTAVLIDAPGAIPSLVMRLTTGPHVRAAARALTAAGPQAVNELIAALPTTRGDGAIAPTAIASGRAVSGTIRAARVLARLGPDACTRVLERFSDLGYRGRNAVARSFATVPSKIGRAIDPLPVARAMDLTIGYAEALCAELPHVGGGLFRIEVNHRIGETAARVLDLASVIGDRALIARARAGLSKQGRERGHALELLENVLPEALATRIVALLERQDGPLEGEGGDARRRPVDGWLEKCRRYDRNELPSSDPMLGVLEKVLALRDSSLFAGLSGEELYPVAEIARSNEVRRGDVVVREGDPGDALFVVVAGTFEIKKGDKTLHTIEKGAAFGELALLDGAPRAATIVATTDGQLLRIPRGEFEALLDESPELARGVIRTLIGHLRGSS